MHAVSATTALLAVCDSKSSRACALAAQLCPGRCHPHFACRNYIKHKPSKGLDQLNTQFNSMIIVQTPVLCPSAPVVPKERKMEPVTLRQKCLQELDFEMARRDMAHVTQEDVDVGCLLGTGSFSEVFSVRVLLDNFNEEPTEEDSSSDTEVEQVNDMATQSYRTLTSMSSVLTTSGAKYALKTIRKDFAGDKAMTALAVRDAYYEAEILSHLPAHPNVVNLLGIHPDFWKDPTQGFLILERVEETLKHRLARWNRTANSIQNTSILQFVKRQKDRFNNQRRRIELCGVGIARAFKFLHKHGIVYRDLKPANIGFGYDGNVKLFDFGLARRYVPMRNQPRRMAPEVCLHEDYGLPADIHSYGILLWEVCTLEKPYGNFSSLDQLQEKTVKEQSRPSLRKIASPQLRSLLKACWDPDPRARPTFALVCEEVEAICRP